MTPMTVKYNARLKQAYKDKVRGMMLAKKVLHQDLIKMDQKKLKKFIAFIMRRKTARRFGIAQYAYLILCRKLEGDAA